MFGCNLFMTDDSVLALMQLIIIGAETAFHTDQWTNCKSVINLIGSHHHSHSTFTIPVSAGFGTYPQWTTLYTSF